MRYLRSLVRHDLPCHNRPITSSRGLCALALAVALAIVAAVPAVAGSARTRSHAAKPRHGSPYQRLVHLRRLGREPSPGTHSRTARLPGHELPALRTATSRTYQRADGTYVARTYPINVNFR